MATVHDLLARKGGEMVSILPTDTVLEAARRMNERGIGGLLVVEGGQLAGIFTERDILRRVVALGRDPTTTPVKTVMTSPVSRTRKLKKRFLSPIASASSSTPR